MGELEGVVVGGAEVGGGGGGGAMVPVLPEQLNTGGPVAQFRNGQNAYAVRKWPTWDSVVVQVLVNVDLDTWVGA